MVLQPVAAMMKSSLVLLCQHDMQLRDVSSLMYSMPCCMATLPTIHQIQFQGVSAGSKDVPVCNR